MFGAILKFFVIGLLAIVGLGLALGSLGAVFGVAVALAALALKVAVIGAIGYGAVKVFQAITGRGRQKVDAISAEDRKWLES